MERETSEASNFDESGDGVQARETNPALTTAPGTVLTAGNLTLRNMTVSNGSARGGNGAGGGGQFRNPSKLR